MMIARKITFLQQRSKDSTPGSKFAQNVYDKLREIYPYYTIDTELYFNYKGKKFYWDFFIRELKVAIECQGAQHEKFVRVFHGDKEGLIKSKRRDKLKREYAHLNEIVVVEIQHDDEITIEKIKEIIIGAIDDHQRLLEWKG